MKIICILNSKVSFERIKNDIHVDGVNWTYEASLERFRLSLPTNYYDLAIVDQSIQYYDEFIDLLNLKDVKMIIFRGVFDEIVAETTRRINDYLIREQEEDSSDFHEENEESMKVMIKEVVRTELVEVPVIHNFANKLISVVNLSERAGSTFVSSNLARALSQKNLDVTLYENPIGNVDAYYTMSLYDDSKSFYSYRQSMKQSGRVDKRNLAKVHGVSIAVNEPYKADISWDSNDTLKLFASNSGINIVDLGWNYNDDAIKDILNISDTIYLVIDPLPTMIVRNEGRLIHFEEMRNSGIDVQYIFNKWSSSINTKKFINGFNMQPAAIIPFIPIDSIYQNYYDSDYNFLIDHKIEGDTLYEAFSPLLQDYNTDEDVSLKRNKKKLFSFLRQ